MSVSLRAFTCGWFPAPLSFYLSGEDRSVVRSPIPAYLIEHSRGKALFDTGLGLRFRHSIEERLATDATGFEFDKSADIAMRLHAVGVDLGAIGWIINSRFHADHCGGNGSIPNANILVQRREREAARTSENAKLYDPADYDRGRPVLAIGGEHDLFEDGIVVVVLTPGHMPGHQSVIVQLSGGDVLLAADCCYLEKSLDGLITSPRHHDPAQARATLERLAGLRHAGTRIFFGHDGGFWKTLPMDGVIC
jgi:N-acyl homoserine lactone hydrolase